VLARSSAASLKDRNTEELTFSELVTRFFGYDHRFRPEEHRRLRAAFERATGQRTQPYAGAGLSGHPVRVFPANAHAMDSSVEPVTWFDGEDKNFFAVQVIRERCAVKLVLRPSGGRGRRRCTALT
jgi:hypothetical protein